MSAKLKIKYLLTAVFVGGGLFVSAHGASAAYFKTGSMVSANLLTGQTYVGAITSFDATASTSADTSVNIQFSRNKLIWYDRLGTAYASTTLANGANSLDLTPLSWIGPVLYYKLNFYTNGGTNTASVSEVTVNYDASASPTSDYFREGTLVSKNMLDGITDAGAITQFSATADIPAGAAITAQFSLNKLVWYDRLGTAYASTTLANGANNLDLSGLNWSGPMIYYKLHFATNDSGVTGSVSYTQIQYSAGAGTTIQYNQGALLSKDLLGSATNLAIQYFGYNLSSLPAGTTATIMFATTTDAFYNAAGTLWASSTLAVGNHLATLSAISLIPLDWSAKNFYYKIIFSTVNPAATPVLTEVALYAPAPVCGDRICSSPETHATCPADCPLTANTSGATQINSPLSGRFKDASLVGYWSFDGANMGTTSATDLSGNSNTGWLNNGVKKTEGINGQGLKFDGVDDYVKIPGTSSLNMTSNFTITMWIKPEAGNNFLFAKDQSVSYGYNIFNYGSPTNWNVLDGGGNARGNGDATRIIGQWQQIVLVIDQTGTSATIYKNGVAYSFSLLQQFGGGISDLFLGCRKYWDGSQTEYYSGLMDEVRVYNRALSAAEISQLYSFGAARAKVNTPAAAPNGGLVGYWSFNGADISWPSNTAYDRSGSSPANNGTITNMSMNSAAVPGISGQGLSFDGVDDYVTIPTITASIITISAWIKSTLTANPQGIVTQYIANNQFRLNADGNLRFLTNATNDIDIITTGINAADGKWHHVVAVNDGVNAYIYMDDVQRKSGTGSTNSRTWDRIGSYMLNEGIAGLIDEVRIYNRALGADEVLQLYRIGSRKVEIKQ